MHNHPSRPLDERTRLLMENDALRKRLHTAETQISLICRFPAPHYVKPLYFSGQFLPAFSLSAPPGAFPPPGYVFHDLLPGHVPVFDEATHRWLQCYQPSADAIHNAAHERSARIAAETEVKALQAKLAVAEARADKLEQQLTALEHTATTLKKILDISTQEGILGAHVFWARPVSRPESPHHPTEPLPRTILGHTRAQVDLTKPPTDFFLQ